AVAEVACAKGSNDGFVLAANDATHQVIAVLLDEGDGALGIGRHVKDPLQRAACCGAAVRRVAVGTGAAACDGGDFAGDDVNATHGKVERVGDVHVAGHVHVDA